MAGNEGFYSENKVYAGWRYGFVAMQKNGKRVYSKMNRAVNSVNQTVNFIVPDDTQFLWLVVTGAPDKHTKYHQKMEQVAEWPYRIKISKTSFHPDTL